MVALVFVAAACFGGSTPSEPVLPPPLPAVDSCPLPSAPSVCESLVCRFPEARSAPEPMAVALAQAMLANDRLAGGMSCSYCTLVWTSDAQTWFPLAQVGEIVDECGRWYRHQRLCWRTKDKSRTCSSGESSFDGQQVYAQQDKECGNGALIQPQDPYQTMAPGYSPTRFLGRSICYNQRELLGELLLKSQDLSTVQGAARGLIRLHGTIDAQNQTLIIDVDVDPSRGFAPVRIATFDGLTGSPWILLKVDEMSHIDGAWVPVRGVRRAFEDVPPPIELQKQFKDALKQAGIEARVDPRDASARRRFQRVVSSVFGEAGWRYAEDQSVSPAVLTGVVISKVGIGCDAPLPRVEFRADSVRVDALRHIGSDGQPAEAPDAASQDSP